MFFVYVIEDKIMVLASELQLLKDKNFEEIVENKIKDKYIDKFLENEGFCVSIYSLVVKDSIIISGEADIQANVIYIHPRIEILGRN
jgi:DNA-directed RNA polymerase subunit E'/Rpb7